MMRSRLARLTGVCLWLSLAAPASVARAGEELPTWFLHNTLNSSLFDAMRSGILQGARAGANSTSFDVFMNRGGRILGIAPSGGPLPKGVDGAAVKSGSILTVEVQYDHLNRLFDVDSVARAAGKPYPLSGEAGRTLRMSFD